MSEQKNNQEGTRLKDSIAYCPKVHLEDEDTEETAEE